MCSKQHTEKKMQCRAIQHVCCLLMNNKQSKANDASERVDGGEVDDCQSFCFGTVRLFIQLFFWDKSDVFAALVTCVPPFFTPFV